MTSLFVCNVNLFQLSVLPCHYNSTNCSYLHLSTVATTTSRGEYWILSKKEKQRSFGDLGALDMQYFYI